MLFINFVQKKDGIVLSVVGNADKYGRIHGKTKIHAGKNIIKLLYFFVGDFSFCDVWENLAAGAGRYAQIFVIIGRFVYVPQPFGLIKEHFAQPFGRYV